MQHTPTLPGLRRAPARQCSRPRRIGRRRVGLVALVAFMFAGAGCGADDGPKQASQVPASATPATTPQPTSQSVSTTNSDGNAATPATRPATQATSAPAQRSEPQAIVSLSPTATEMLFAVGAGDQLAAVDTLSNYPADAVSKQTGIEAFTPNVEAIAALQPDLVITDGSNAALLEQLDGLGLRHWEGPAARSLDDVYAQLSELGTLTGHADAADKVIQTMRTEIDDAVGSAPRATGQSYYHELDSNYYTATSMTFIGQVYGLFGLTNIADAAPGGADAAYPQLSAEYIVAANPDLVYLACGAFCSDTPETVANRPGWSNIAAVANNRIVALDADVASRWGPRVVTLVRTIAASLAESNQSN